MMRMMNLWDMLPTELKDAVFRMTDLETAVRNNNAHAISFFKRERRYRRQLEWADAARHGRVILMEYMLRTGTSTTHSGRLIETALLHGQLEAASFLLTHERSIAPVLWPSKRQRWHNRALYDGKTVELLLSKGKYPEAAWLLEKTSAPVTAAAYDQALRACPVDLFRALSLRRGSEDVPPRCRHADHVR